MTSQLPTTALKPPGAVIDIARTLIDAGFETWCVGGAVRDALLGESHLDWDLATAATPKQVQRLFRRTIPVGIEFGTVGVLDRNGRMHEVTTFRKDVHTDGRHAVVEFGASLDEDLARRDFTINAIAFEPIARRLYDPFNGRADLDARIVRAVGTADERMAEDRLRALRAMRFASRFGFGIEASTWRAIERSAPFMSRLSPERVKQEMEKTMEQVRRPSEAFVLWQRSGAFSTLVPVLATVPMQTFLAIDALRPPSLVTRPWRRQLRMAALLSSLDGRTAEDTLRSLRFSNAEIAWVGALVDRWHRLGPEIGQALMGDVRIADATLRGWAAAIGRLRVAPTLRLAAACWAGSQAQGDPAPRVREVRALYRRLVRTAFHDAIEIADLAIDGDDLRTAGIRPGPIIGRILNQLIADVIADPTCNTREWLLARALASANDPSGLVDR